MSNFIHSYKINSGYSQNQLYNNKNRNRISLDYYYPNNTKKGKNSNLSYNYLNFNTNASTYFNAPFKTNIIYHYNLNENSKNNFTKNNINFNTHSDKKIKLTYEFENISPNEITDKKKELINLQSQMCSLNSNNTNNTNNINRDSYKNKKPKKHKNISRSQKYLKTNNLSNLTYLTTSKKNSKNFRRNKTFDDILNINNNIFQISTSKNRNNVNKRAHSNYRNNDSIKIWKDKCIYLDEEIKKVKNSINEIKNNNKIFEKRLKYVKDKEENKYILYDQNYNLKNNNNKLLKKYKLSEEIKKQQIELIIKMQKEVNNMRLKLQMLEESCL